MSYCLRILVFAATAIPVAFAADPLVGTWQADVTRNRYDTRHAVTTYEPYEDSGIKYSGPMGPVYSAHLDDREYPVEGAFASSDKVKVKKLGNTSYEVTRTRNGRKYSVERVEVRDGGKTLVSHVTTYPEHGTPTSNVYYYNRVGTPAAVNPLFRQWEAQPEKTEYTSGPPTVVIEEQSGTLKLTFPSSGMTYTTALDGSQRPVAAMTGTTVAARRIDPRTVELTMRRDGRITAINRLTVDPDGKTMAVQSEPHLPNGETRSQTFVYSRE